MTTRRQQYAERTKRDILDAARRLFAEKGYSATTVPEIAAEADVSIQTIYNSVGSKAALVVELNDLIRERAGMAEVAHRNVTATDPDELLSISAEATRRIIGTSGDIVRAAWAAADVEPELARVRDEGTRRHRAATRVKIARMVELGHLEPDVDVDHLSDTVAALTQPELWFALIDHYGWDLDAVAEWADRMVHLVAQPHRIDSGD